MEDYLQLMIEQEAMGEWAFSAEKQNEPVNYQDCYFSLDQITFWDDYCDSVEELRRRRPTCEEFCYRFYAGVDPSLGKSGNRHDYSAIVVLMQSLISDTCYVVEADIQKRKPDRLLMDLLEYGVKYNLHTVAIEAIQFQEYLFDRLIELRRLVPKAHFEAIKLHHKLDKETRIRSLQPFIAAGQLQLCRNHTLLLQQLREFPKGSHDDGPDALEMAFSLCADKPHLVQGEIHGSVSSRESDSSKHSYLNDQIRQILIAKHGEDFLKLR